MQTRGMQTLTVLAVTSLVGLTACQGQPGDAPSGPATTPGVATASGSASPSPASGSASPSASQLPSAAVTPVVPAAPPASSKPVAAGSGKAAAAMVRVQVNNCAAMSSGAGFFVTDDLVLTAGHLFKNAASVAVHSPGGVVRGQLLGTDAATDVALVKLLPTGDGSRLSGSPLSLPAKDPAAGAKVTTLGYPHGKGLHQASGSIGAAGQQATVAENSLDGLLSHSANAAPGNSGGPLLDASGAVVGMELATGPTGEGAHHAVPASSIAPLLKAWRAKPTPPRMVKCVESGPPSMTSIHPDAPAVKTALTRYLWGLSYPTQTEETTGLTGLQVAWQGLGPAEQKRWGSPAKFQAAHKGQIAAAANVDNLAKRDEFTDTLIWTLQLEGPGKKCQVHTQQVVLSSAPGYWVVDSASDSQPPRTC